MPMLSSKMIVGLFSLGGWLCAALWGMLWGSFANVCIHRIPLKQSIVRPKSHCPHCETPLRFYHNIPVVSWVFLRGKCAFCRAPVSWRYPLVEILMGLVAVLLYGKFVDGQHVYWPMAITPFLIYFFFVLTLAVLSFIDGAYFLLPNVITYPAIPVFFVLGRLINTVVWYDAVIGAVVGYVFIRVFADLYRFFTKRDGLGYGDGKLLSIVGGLLGWQALPTTLLLGSVLGMVLAIPWFVLKRSEKSDAPLRQQPMPFGPFLSLGAFGHLMLFGSRDPISVLLEWFF